MRTWIRLCFCILCLSTGWALAQQQGQGGQDRGDEATPRNQGEVIQIEALRLDVRAELPQVQIVGKRKKADFAEVEVKKSFESELSGKSEELQFNSVAGNRIKRIENIERLLNKKRF